MKKKMKKLTTILVAGSAALFMTACGGGSSSTSTDTGYVPPTSSIVGTGTSDDPYIVGSGEFTFDESKYFEIISTKEDCNVIAYAIANLNPFGQTTMFDDAFEEIPQEDGYVYNMPSLGTYTIKANSYKGTGTLGIYSACIDQPNASYDIDNVLINSQNTFPLDTYSKLYKFYISNDSNVTVKNISNTDYVYYYDSGLNNIFTTYKGESIELTSGAYYVLVTQFGWGSEETPTFYFSVE